MNAQSQIETPADVIAAIRSRPRAVRQEVLCNAIEACDPQDAPSIMLAALEGMETGGPGLTDMLGRVREDAVWWADIAPQHELQEYVYAGMKRLAGGAMGSATRKRFIVALWNGLSADDRAAFLAHVGNGK
jgi:hypothetical protein